MEPPHDRVAHVPLWASALALTGLLFILVLPISLLTGAAPMAALKGAVAGVAVYLAILGFRHVMRG